MSYVRSAKMYAKLYIITGTEKTPSNYVIHPEIQRSMEGVKFIADHFKEDNRLIQVRVNYVKGSVITTFTLNFFCYLEDRTLQFDILFKESTVCDTFLVCTLVSCTACF